MKVVFIILLIAGAFYLFFEYGMPLINGPKFENVSVDSIRLRQREAQQMLRKAQIKQKSYQARNSKYTWYLDSLDIPSKGTYYKMKVTDIKTTYFSLRAEGNIDNDKTIDVWIILNDGQPKNLVDDAIK
ncbi:hypothetical protein KAH81_04965 [bacterium]|nr:hypothetical protein [bacterium]